MHAQRLFPISVCFVSAALCACGGGSSSGAEVTTSQGFVNGQPFTSLVDPNEGGQSSTPRLVEVRWGKLVDVYDALDADQDPSTPPVRSLVYSDVLVGESVVGDGSSYLLEEDPFTGALELTILADAGSDAPAAGSLETEGERFSRLLQQAELAAEVLAPTGTGASALPPFPFVPRNAALSLRFSDLLEPDSVGRDTVRLLGSTPPSQPVAARVIPDPNHGAFLGGRLMPTRVLVDPAVDFLESLEQALPVNPLGLPAGVSDAALSGVLRVPTKLDAATGQFRLLRNASGHALSFNGSAPNQSNATRDVLRAFRAGRSDEGADNLDPNNGFLFDGTPPSIVGAFGFTALAPMLVTPDPDLGEAPDDLVFRLGVAFDQAACALAPRRGNLLELVGDTQPLLFAWVTRPSSPPSQGVSHDVRVRLLRPAGVSAAVLATELLGAQRGTLRAAWDGGPGLLPECFVQVSPAPSSPPNRGLSPDARFTVSFSEPMDPSSVSPHDNFRLDRANPPQPLARRVPARIAAEVDLRTFRLTPVAPLDHDPGTSGTASSTDEYLVCLVGGAEGLTDLAGNALDVPFPAGASFELDPAAPEARSGGVVLAFDALDEDGNGTPTNPLPEVRGQLVFDPDAGLLRPRPVTRQSLVVDRVASPVVNLMTPATSGVPEPMAPLGSRLMTVWRYADVGFRILDDATANVDVEGLSWVPFSGSVQSEFFERFEITLSHSARLPDEILDTAGAAAFPASGLLGQFDANALSDPLSERRVVHPRDRGFLLSPLDVFTGSTGSRQVPLPMNRGLSPESFEYFTWRDTAILGGAGTDSFGAEIQPEAAAGLTCFTMSASVYPPGQVRTMGLPLLMEFKCFPSSSAGLNAFDTSLVTTSDGLPVFRIHSTGGFGPQGQPLQLNPDAALVAAGGGLAGTPALEGRIHLGQLDIVTRVSRVHTVWLASGTAGTADWLDPVIEPPPEQQPFGTGVVLAFRGADQVVGADVGDSSKYDPYGDPLEATFFDPADCANPVAVNADITVSFKDGDATWKPSIHDVDGAEFVQVRITFVSNAASGLSPALSTMALPYRF